MKLLEKLYIIFSLMYFAGGLTPSDLAENQHSIVINRANSLLQLVVFPVLLVFVVIHWKQLSTKIRAFALPAAFCGLALLSTAWSPSPGFTLRRGFITLGFTVFSFYLGSRLTLPEQVNLYGWMTVVFVFSTYLLVVMKPEWALSTGNHWGSWRGVFGHKNTLGRMASFGAIVLLAGRPRAIPGVLRTATALGSVALIFFSGSATSVMAAVIVCALAPLLPILKVRARKTLPLWLALLPLATFFTLAILANFGSILEGLGRDPTLTGRTTLWNAILDVGAKRPILGFGYASFWHYNGPELKTLDSRVGWTPPHAHNAYLDMWLDLGYVGLILMLSLIALTFFKSAKLYQLSPSRSARFPLLFLILIVCANCTESDLFRSHSFLWCPLVALYSSLKLLEDPRAQRGPKLVSTTERGDRFINPGGAELEFAH